MSLITRMLRQLCVYWPYAGNDDTGQPTYDAPLELKCRWEGSAVEFTDKAGKSQMSRAVVYLAGLPDGSDPEMQSVIWLSTARASDPPGSALEQLVDIDDPYQNQGAYEIRQMDITPNLRNTEKVRTAYL